MTVSVLIFKAYTSYKSDGIILIGTLYILYGYLRRVGDTFNGFANLYGSIVQYDARIQNAEPIDEEFEKVKSEITKNLPENWQELEIKDLDFTYDQEGKEKHMNSVSLKIKRGQKIALIGESGSGKSTLLRCLNHLETVDEGRIIIDGILLNDSKTNVNKVREEIGMVFQQFNLFPHMTALENITIAQMKVRRRSKRESEKILQRLFRKI